MEPILSLQVFGRPECGLRVYHILILFVLVSQGYKLFADGLQFKDGLNGRSFLCILFQHRPD